MAAPGQSRAPRPARGFARLAASLIVLFTLLVILKRGQPPRASTGLVHPPVPAAAELASALSTGGKQTAEEQAKQGAAEPAAGRERADGGGGGGLVGAPSGDSGESPTQPDRKAEPAAAKAALQASPAAQPAAQAGVGAQPAAAAAAAAPAASGGQQPQLEQVARVDIGAKADVYLGFQVLLRAQVTPFRKCKVTQYQAKPMNDAQVTALLRDSSKLAGQLWWADVNQVPCRRDGCCKQLFSFRYGTTDILVFQQIFRDHYLRALYSLFPEDAAPKYILDAGANAGYATALFKLLWPDAVVVSMEPDPGNFAQMRRNTAGFTGVHRVNAGLWGRRANITLSSGGQAGAEWGKTFRDTQPGEAGVPAYSVNDIAKMFGIPKFDFVKIDIEGAEGRVFAPGADLSWLGSPRVVSLEIHDFFASKFGLTAVSGYVDAAFANHPQYQIARDNEHVFYIDKDHLAAARLSGAVRAAGAKP